jgi:hypothetical protein
MGALGFAYIPEACSAGAACRLHIALHGCKQSREVVGEDYARLTEYNRWAEANDIVILYPQAESIPAPWWNWFGGNPNGCWDWWGYDDPAYHTRSGRQMAAVAAMTSALGAPIGTSEPGGQTCVRHDDANWSHALSGRASFCGFFSVCETGSGELIGPAFGFSAVFESPPGVFSTTPC